MQSHDPPMITHMSTKGQVVIPRALREALGLRSGMPLSVQRINGGIVLKPSELVPHPIMKLFGIFHRPGEKSISDREMNDAIAEMVAKDDERIMREYRASRRRKTTKKPKK